MSLVDSTTRAGATSTGSAPGADGRKGRRLRRVLAVGAVAAGLGGVALVVGFLQFAARIQTHEVALGRSADGIVVLTGGSSRIADALELLGTGHGRRLLISGVHRATTAREIARLMPAYRPLFSCCVDLDRSAVNTVGNALETRRWVTDRGFKSLIVVTSSYHMPRSMAELGRQLPDVTLVPFPVVTDKLKTDAWWASPGTAKLLLSEYLKYILAHVRMQIERTPTSTGLVGNRGGTEG